MRRQIGSLVLVSLAGSCVDSDELGSVAKQAPPCVAIDDRSLVEADPAIVNDSRFSLLRIFEAIRATTPASHAVPDAREMFHQLYTAYGTCGVAADPAGFGLRCRDAEYAIAALDPFTSIEGALHFRPVAVLGRYDMANERAGTCGEARIVYWMDAGPVAGKAGVIVELFTPPVIDRHGHGSCAPVAQFWASLSSEPDPQARAQALERFFFTGLPGMPFAPASAAGAGWYGRGQLRANNFASRVQWNLREAAWRGRCDGAGCTAGFVLVDSKNSPSDKLFAQTHAAAPAFEHWFLSKAVPRLAKARTADALSLGNPPAFDAFESISQPLADDPSSVRYALVASPALRARVADKLGELGSGLSVDNILDRATAATCAGCHRISRGADLGGGLVFPAPLGFVHVGESGELSPAMVEQFLPARRRILQDEVCGRGHVPDDATLTLAGHAISEPN